MLKAPLHESEPRWRQVKTDAMSKSGTEVGWGGQTDSYGLQPYQAVKDLRTGAEAGRAQAVFDGDIDRFLETSPAGRVGKDNAVAKD